MAQVIYSRIALRNLKKLIDFLVETEPHAATLTAGLIDEAISVLERHPLIGRPIDGDRKELIISRGKTGYAALYGFDTDHDAVLIYSIRHQRDVGYRGV